MALNQLVFRPRLLPTVFLLILVPAFSGLGLWQVQRLGEKKALAADIDRRQNLPPLTFEQPLTADPELVFRRVSVSGEFDGPNQVLIDNQVHQGQPGYHVIAPLRIEGTDRAVLVNRGWVTAGRDREPPAGLDTPEGRIRVEGQLGLPKKPPLAGAMAPAPGPSWGGVWPYLNTDYLGKRSGAKLEPVIILQSPDDPGGFVRAWPEFETKEIIHTVLAVQWFAFAIISVGVYLGLCVSVKKPVDEEQTL